MLIEANKTNRTMEIDSLILVLQSVCREYGFDSGGSSVIQEAVKKHGQIPTLTLS